jgi:hypothetical protein
MYNREPIRRSELLAAGYTLKQMRVLTEFHAVDCEPCYLAKEVEEKLGHEEGGKA